MADAVGSIDTPDAQDEAQETKKKARKGGKRAKKGPLKRLALFYRQVIAELRKVVWPTRNPDLVHHRGDLLRRHHDRPGDRD